MRFRYVRNQEHNKHSTYKKDNHRRGSKKKIQEEDPTSRTQKIEAMKFEEKHACSRSSQGVDGWIYNVGRQKNGRRSGLPCKTKLQSGMESSKKNVCGHAILSSDTASVAQPLTCKCVRNEEKQKRETRCPKKVRTMKQSTQGSCFLYQDLLHSP